MAQIRATSEKIEQWPIEKLRPYDKNPKLHPQEQIDKICKSIRSFGFINPIIVHTDHGIIAGHGRLAAAKKIKLLVVPVILADHLSIDEVKAYLLADNKIGEGYGYDDALLTKIIEELDATAFDLSLTGFSDKELSNMLNPALETTEDELNVSEVKDEKQVPIIFGKLKFTVKQDKYSTWMNEISGSGDKDNDLVVREIIRRLGI